MSQTLFFIPHRVDSVCQRERALVGEWIESGLDIRIFPVLPELESLAAIDQISEQAHLFLGTLDRLIRNAGKGGKTGDEFELAPMAGAFAEIVDLFSQPPWALRKRLRVPTGPIAGARDLVERARLIVAHASCSPVARIDYFD